VELDASVRVLLYLVLPLQFSFMKCFDKGSRILLPWLDIFTFVALEAQVVVHQVVKKLQPHLCLVH
jgi:hypothetical protein